MGDDKGKAIGQGFRDFLVNEGFSDKTVKTYFNAVRSSLGMEPDEPWRVLNNDGWTRRTKGTYHAALRSWAAFSGDEELEGILDSKAVRKLLSSRSGALSKTTEAIPDEQVDLVMDLLEREYRYEDPSEHPKHKDGWVWPCISLMIKTAMRAGVDLTWISSVAVDEALRNGETLTIVSKGSKERQLPIGAALEELEALAAHPKWKTVADIVAPRAMEKRRHDAAYEKIRRKLKKIAAEAGLDPAEVKTHRFRHSAALWMWRKTNDLLLVRDLLGHSSVSVTETYLRTQRVGEIGEALSDRFGGADE